MHPASARGRRGLSARSRQDVESQTKALLSSPFFFNRTYLKMKDFHSSRAKLNDLKKKKDEYEKQQESIANRLVLMKNEELKTKRQIEDTVRRAKSIEEYRKTKEEFLKRKEEVRTINQ
jgi:hypothetical protein